MPRALINVHSFLQDFNPTKFTVYFSALIFSVLFSLKLDNKISFSYWLVFLPLWIWKGLAFLGASVGIFIWLRNPDYRASHSSYVHFKSMLISLSLQLLLLMFEILVCDKLESRRHTWTLAFVPLLFISLLSISVCIWLVKNGRGIELEFFAAINILQIVLLALKLDNFVNWSWIIVFIPSWVLLCFAVVVMLYAMIFAAIVLRSSDGHSDHRHASIHSASASSMIFLPILVFIILLTSKLDSPPGVATPGYFVTCLPLFATLLILIRMSFVAKPGSLWWFGMRTDFCTYLLHICPCLKEYGNTSFTIHSPFDDSVADASTTSSGHENGGLSIPTNSVIISTDHNSPSDDHDLQQPSGHSSFQNDTKRLLHSLSQVLFRDKSVDNNQKNNQPQNDQMFAKLALDVPD